MKEYLKSYIQIFGSKALFDYEQLEGFLKEKQVPQAIIHQMILVLECSNLQGTLERIAQTASAVEINNMIVVCYRNSGLHAELIRARLFEALEALNFDFSNTTFYLPSDSSNEVEDESSLRIASSVILPPDQLENELERAEAMLNDNPAEALAKYIQLSKCGSSVAMYQVAMAYFEGRGTERDEDKALRWFRAAAANGDPRANYYMGKYYYENSNILKRNLKLAYEYYTAPGSYYVNDDAKKNVISIINKQKTNIITLTLAGLALLCMWIFTFLVHTSVHNGSNFLVLGIILTVIATVLFSGVVFVYVKTLYQDTKVFLPIIMVLWAIYPLLLAIN